MLFNSYEFLFLFLPATVFVYYLLGAKKSARAAFVWLVLASLFFYGWWNPVYLLLIVSSICFNYFIARTLRDAALQSKGLAKKLILAFGISANLFALGYFKYANFLVDTANSVFGTDVVFLEVILPLAISFFTFQQITFLVDAYRDVDGFEMPGFINYSLFVTFFPQLIAGPIVHHREMLPQFQRDGALLFNNNRLAVGFTVFVIGLFKKVVIADTVAEYSTPVFDAALRGENVSFLEAWVGAVGYTLQLYFDFSGYSDMAVGLAWIFGIRLVINFFSPYKATSIIDFWRRWHISLSRFLREYVYIPLGGNRRGPVRRFVNLFLTMLIGGVWHGAGWTFVAWGALHGFYLIVNNFWRQSVQKVSGGKGIDGAVATGIYRIITLLAVIVGWVVFRAESFSAAAEILRGMAGVNGLIIPTAYSVYVDNLIPAASLLFDMGWLNYGEVAYYRGIHQIALPAVLLLWTLFAPNIYQFMGDASPGLNISRVSGKPMKSRFFRWTASLSYAIGILFLWLIIVIELDGTSEFLYFQF